MPKRNVLRESISTISYTYRKLENGDIRQENPILKEVRANVIQRSSAIDRIYEVPQLEYDLVVRMRKKSFNAAFVTEREEAIYRGSKYELVESQEESDRITVAFLKRTD